MHVKFIVHQDHCYPGNVQYLIHLLIILSAHAGLAHLDFCCASNRRDEDITDEGVEALAQMTALQSLNLSGHKEVTADGLAFLADCTAMTSLDLSGELLSPSHGTEKPWVALASSMQLRVYLMVAYQMKAAARCSLLLTSAIRLARAAAADMRTTLFAARGQAGCLGQHTWQESLMPLLCKLLTELSFLGAETGLAAGGCQFLAGMEQLRTLSLARTRLAHASLVGVMDCLTTLTTLSLAW